ncbi:MAG: hypothetical protein J5938_05120, partial [Clostridia bacterium]|nr:hypothetical protein [Clostridia bacterium]
MKKRAFCFLLALLVSGAFTACSERTADPDPEAPPSTPATGVQTQPTETEPPQETLPRPELPEKDYDGYSFLLIAGESYLARMLCSEMNGEVVNDAIYQANQEVSDQFNIKLDQNAVNDRDMNLIKGYIMSGQDDYDLACFHDCDTASMSLNGWFHNIHELPCVDTGAAWWPQFTVESLTVNHKMYYFSNYISYNSSSATQVAFFNKGLMTD